jgi:energy-coupling factor transporter ATP-binding protein EcfA2
VGYQNGIANKMSKEDVIERISGDDLSAILGIENHNSTSFRDIAHSSLVETYYHLYGKTNKIPSVVRNDRLKSDVFKFLQDTNRFELIAASKSKEQEQPEANGYFNEDNLYVYLDKSSDSTKNVIVKLGFKTLKQIWAEVASYDVASAEKTSDDLSKFTINPEPDKVQFAILAARHGDIYVKEYDLTDTYCKTIDLSLNYGTDFPKHHERIVDRLLNKTHGLFIFHGAPGSGKTTYIKHLAHVMDDKKKFIFIPTTFIDSLVSPNIIPVLLENQNSVLILEDAEKAVVARDAGMGNESLASSLLNIGDGILGSMLNISMIVTFNTGKENIDKALLRKGRLMYEHNFDLLSESDSQKLLDTLGKGSKATGRMSLADIYNFEVETNHQEEKRQAIGFSK